DAAKKPYLASMGIYVFDYEKLKELLSDDDSAVDFGGQVIPQAIKKCNVQAHLFDGYWEDIGTIRAFYEANLDLAAPLPKFNFFNAESPIYTRSRYLPPSKLHNCDVDNSMVSEGCILNGVYARNSIIGLRSRLEPGTRIESSIVMGSDYFESLDEMKLNVERGVPHMGIGANATVRKAIIDKNVRIGRDVKLLNQAGKDHFDAPDSSYFIRDGIIIVPKGGQIPDGTEV
ncbi:MAG: sugar phosphate nucleotidyltransferase, partial [bacterium]|nr:sugar phosphate nucleotidyltransferase [bacterium]